VSGVCEGRNCDNLLHVLFSPQLSFVDNFTLLSFGLPGFVMELLIALHNIRPSFTSQPPISFIMLFILTYLLYVIPAAVIITIVLKLTRLLLRKYYPYHKEFKLSIFVVGVALLIGGLNVLFVGENKKAYTVSLLDPSSVLRDTIRKQHLQRLKNGFEAYRVTHGNVPKIFLIINDLFHPKSLIYVNSYFLSLGLYQ